MSSLHNLKIKTRFYNQVVSRQTKTYEIRKNDRNYKRGDAIVFWEVDANGLETGCKSKPFIITSEVLCSAEFEGLADGYCSFSIEPHGWFALEMEGGE